MSSMRLTGLTQCVKVTEAFSEKFLTRARSIIDPEIGALAQDEQPLSAHAAIGSTGKARWVFWETPQDDYVVRIAAASIRYTVDAEQYH